jgi:hypothetical protein
MFDSPHVLEPLLNSEQAAALVKVHPKTLQRYARNGIVAGLRLGKLWRFPRLGPPRSITGRGADCNRLSSGTEVPCS